MLQFLSSYTLYVGSFSKPFFKLFQDNITTETISISDEKASGGFSCFTEWGVVLSLTYGAGLVLNVLHLVVLLTLPSLKKTANQTVLVHITLSDIAIAVTRTLYFSCSPYFYYLVNKSTLVPHVIGTSILDWTNFIGYFVFFFGSIEKFYAFCRPLKYQSTAVVKHLPICFGLTWIVLLLVTVIEVYIRATLLHSASSKTLWKVCFIVILPFPPSVLSAALLMRVYREIRSMKVHDTVTAQAKQTKVAARYFMVIFVLFIIVWVLNIIFLSARFITEEGVYIRIFHLFKSSYTIFNTVLYGWMSRPYRQYVRDKFKVCGHKSQVVTNEPTAQQTNSSEL